MKLFYFLVAAFLLLSTHVYTQVKIIEFNDTNWSIQGGQFVDYQGQKSLKGTAVLNDVEFENGIIEFDINVTGARCFAGINFRMQSTQNGEHFYLRPHKSNQVDALQYTPIFNGTSSWQLYNGEGFTNTADIPYDKWVHIKLEIMDSQARVYLNNSETPTMVMPYLKWGKSKGFVSLFAPPNGVAHFANFSLNQTDDLQFEPAPKLFMPVGTIQNWELSQPLSFFKVDMNEHPVKQGLNLNWQNVNCDETGLVDICRYTSRSGFEPDVIFARTVIRSNKDELRLFNFGYSDAIQIFINGELTFGGQSYFRQRDPGFQGIAGLFDSVRLPLKKGENEILLQLVETMGGWGFYFQDADFRIQDAALTEKWELNKGINIPESVVYDKKRNILYASNFSAYSPRGQQTISTISTDGKLLKYDFVSGLQRPTGMQIYKDKLYVVDRLAVSEIDLDKGEILKRINIPNPVFPNDIVITDEGVMYVSDNDKSVIFKYQDDEFSEWLKGDEVGRPNGLFYSREILYWGNNSDCTFKSIDLKTNAIKTIKEFDTILIDGIKQLPSGDFLISDYEGIVYRLYKSGEAKVLLNTKAEGLKEADFEYVPELKLIVIPSLYSNSVRAYNYND